MALGKAFHEARALSNGEVLAILQKRAADDSANGANTSGPNRQTMNAIAKYLEDVRPVAIPAGSATLVLLEMRRYLEEVHQTVGCSPLSAFEVAALMNLMPLDAEEAIALIPSIEKKATQEQLNEVTARLQALATDQDAGGGAGGGGAGEAAAAMEEDGL